MKSTLPKVKRSVPAPTGHPTESPNGIDGSLKDSDSQICPSYNLESAGEKLASFTTKKGETFDLWLLDVPPELAKQWQDDTRELEARIGRRLNRNPSRGRVKQMAEMLADDDFPFVGDLIRLSPPDPETGKRHILDGGNRISAIIRAQKSLEALVLLGLRREFFPYIDIGAARSSSDLLTIENHPYGPLLSSTARCVWCLERHYNVFSSAIANPKVVDVVRRHESLVHMVEQMSNESSPKNFRVGAIAAAVYWISVTGNPRADEFLEGFLQGIRLQVGSPILLLRDKLFNEEKLRHALRLRGAVLALIFRVWKLFLEGETVQELHVRAASTGRFPWPEGAPYLPIKEVE